MPTLEEMEAEVLAYCQAKGWYDQEVPFPQAMALLHEEAAEVGHAWRDWGIEDRTHGVTAEHRNGGYQAKPEGVGSEFADILIRLLDDDARYELGLITAFRAHAGVHAYGGSFMVDVNTLHVLIARASETWAQGDGEHAAALAGVMKYLVQMTKYYGVDLDFEFRRKMDYNHTREYRHGGRRA